MRTITTEQASALLDKAEAVLTTAGALVSIVARDLKSSFLMRAFWVEEDGSHSKLFLREDNRCVVMSGERLSFIETGGDVISFRLLVPMNCEELLSAIACPDGGKQLDQEGAPQIG